MGGCEKRPSLRIPIFQVDAFTADLFRGNPAAVCPLDAWLEDAKMLAIASENNLSETAFLVPKPGGYGLRWFTPKQEVQLCGHATLASAFVVFRKLDPAAQSVRFDTCSGPLLVRPEGEFLSMDFPALPISPSPKPPAQLRAGLEPRPPLILESAKNAAEGNYFCVYETEDDVPKSENRPPTAGATSSRRRLCHRSWPGVRFCIQILCSQLRHPGGSGDWIHALLPGPVLVSSARQSTPACSATLSTWGRDVL